MTAQRVPALRTAVRALRRAGVDTVFGCHGPALRPLYAALADGGIARLRVRHAESAPHMAIGWARTRGLAGVAAVPAGPGAVRVLPGLAVALEDAVPLVCVVGVPGSGGERTAAARDLVRLARPLSKWTVRAEQPARIPWAFREALWIAQEGRPGPVLIELPDEVAAAQTGADGPDAGRHAGEARPYPPAGPAPAAGPERGHPPDVVREVCALFGTENDAYVVGVQDAVRPTDGPGPRRHVIGGRGGPPGWEVPTAIGVRAALAPPGGADRPGMPGGGAAEVVAVIGEHHGFPALAGELALAARYGVPLVLLMLHPALHAPGLAAGDADDAFLTDHVKLVEAYGCAGRRVTDPAELRSAVAWARKEAVSTRRPVLVEVRYDPAERARFGPAAGPCT
ncbi:thiamine pyrophosphate-binding protein [Streptomyces pinistramenti]|uniref:thiamine pyrophosphate-binding protein n=1 Tax=Streptomyces pinistramenti TaxID=2884812 RepID=UPI001D06B8A4|nr:thiamine pyrophosphate-binding protein [Streptomyces pinistramenti]MCB5908169.1 thiamine pyrophosphate-dependent enzyme [Streptomyces pinistramenti]